MRLLLGLVTCNELFETVYRLMLITIRRKRARNSNLGIMKIIVMHEHVADDVVTKVSVCVQEVSVAAHDVQQLHKALALPAAPIPAAPIRASPPHDSPAAAIGSMTPDKLPKSSQAGSPTTSTASDESATLLEEEESRSEVPGISNQAEAVPSSPVQARNSPQSVKEAARPAVPAASIPAEAVTSSPVKAPSSPQSLMEGDSPVTPMEELSPTRAPATDVPPAIDCASQPVTWSPGRMAKSQSLSLTGLAAA